MVNKNKIEKFFLIYILYKIKMTKFYFVYYRSTFHTSGRVIEDKNKLPALYQYGWKSIGLIEVKENIINILEPLVDVQKLDPSWDYSFLRSSNVVLNQWFEKKCLFQSFILWISNANN
jgi:hypothetical protein